MWMTLWSSALIELKNLNILAAYTVHVHVYSTRPVYSIHTSTLCWRCPLARVAACLHDGLHEQGIRCHRGHANPPDAVHHHHVGGRRHHPEHILGGDTPGTAPDRDDVPIDSILVVEAKQRHNVCLQDVDSCLWVSVLNREVTSRERTSTDSVVPVFKLSNLARVTM